MQPTDWIRLALDPALSLLTEISGRGVDTPEARVMLVAIGLQESRLEHRRQIGGPARGYLQFEKGGGVAGVLRHHASAEWADALCQRLDVEPDADAVYPALADNDILAAGFGRLLLWTDPRPLPPLGDDAAAWDLYKRVWRPGKPHPQTWPALYAQAQRVVASA